MMTIEPLVAISIATITNNITTALEEKFREESRRTISRNNGLITIIKTCEISENKYDVIVEECLLRQLHLIFQRFYECNKSFCIELATQIFSIVYEGIPVSPQEEIQKLLFAYVDTLK